MKRLILSFLLLYSMHLNASAIRCGTAYQDASYAVEHSEKAMQSNNIEHLKQYAQRAKDALSKVFTETEACGCQEANNSSYDALNQIDKALSKDKFEVARFYVKSALTSTRSSIISLDLCNENDPTYDLVIDENNLIDQEQLLIQQQQELLKKQKALEEQLNAQREMQERLKIEKEKKMKAQLALKNESEASLLDLEAAINKFIKISSCSKAEPPNYNSYTRSIEQLEQESINATRAFYNLKAREMADKLIMVLAGCD